MLKIEEKQALLVDKVRKGKLPEQAKLEIQRDIEFCKNTNKLKLVKKQESKQKESDKKKLNENFKKEFAKLTSGMEEKEVKENLQEKIKLRKYADTRILSRILLVLEMRELNITAIAREIAVNNDIVRDGLKFLIRIKLVKEINTGHGIFYSK